MKREVFERQKAFAGEKKPSMLRRCVGHDYSQRQIYMVTMVTEERRPLFGQITGHSEAPANDGNAPRIALTELGQRVHDEWWGIPRYYPQIEILALQMMPDHLHGIIFIREQMEKDLSRVIRGFKTGCNRAYRELVIGGGGSGGGGNGSGGGGNRFLMDRPVKIQVQCSRRLTVEQAPAPHYPTRKRLHRPRQTWRSAHGGLRSWSTALTGPMAASQ